MDETAADYSISYLEDAAYTFKMGRHVTRLSGYFVSPANGEYTFYIKGKHIAKMYLTVRNNTVRVGSSIEK